MNSFKVIGAGFALLGLLLLLAPRLELGRRNPIGLAVSLFIPLWLVAALINLAIGIFRAGDSLTQAASAATIIFGAPACAALLIAWASARNAA